MAGSEKLVATLVDAAEAKNSAIQQLDQQLGASVAKLYSIEDIVLKLQQTKHSMQEQLESVSTAAPDQISQALQRAGQEMARADQLQQEAQQIQQECKEHSVRVDGLLNDVEQQLELLQLLDRVECYQRWVHTVQAISGEMSSLMSSSSSELELLSRYTELEKILKLLVEAATDCTNLKHYVYNMLQYWHTKLLATFSQEFEAVLKSIQYPFLSTNTSALQPKTSPDQLARLKLLTKHLLRLHKLPQALVPSVKTSVICNIVKNESVDSKNSSDANDSRNSDNNSRDPINVDPDVNNSKSSGTANSELNNTKFFDVNNSYDNASNVNCSMTSEGSHQSDFEFESATSVSPNKSGDSNSGNISSPSATNTSSNSATSISNMSPANASNTNTTDSKNADDPAILADFTPLLTPLQLLLKPLQIRFWYHFSGDKKTNSPAHPEWCLTRVLSWISSHAAFFIHNIQPVLDQSQLYCHVSVTSEISRGLVRMVVMKLAQDLAAIISDEDLFCHCLQETLNFERELRMQCGYPASQPSVLIVLTQPKVLKHWIELERKFSVAVMDELVSMDGAWVSEDEGGVSACGEQLVTLLQGITDRYKSLPQPGQRLQFLDVQLDVLDEYRVRGVQLSRELRHSPVLSHYPAILNTLYHVAETLAAWGDMPFFLELHVYRQQQKAVEAAVEEKMAALAVNTSIYEDCRASSPTKEEGPGKLLECIDGSVFDECVSLYGHVQREMMRSIQQHVMTEVRARFMPYRRDKWFLEPNKSASNVRCCDISGSLCPLLEVLARQLHCLRRVLATPLFTELWHTLARDIDKFMFEELVLQNHFSDVGAAQFEHDMTKALFPMFSEFTNRPESHFVFVKESLTLLTLPLAPALLLRDTLRQALQGNVTDTLRLAVIGSTRRDAAAVPGVIEPAAALADHAVNNVLPEYALRVLNARNNISSL
uniref:RAD50-interacting protein 1-like n=1 Tax=Hirondellea gigas TaxID=1518452 RepID=A0A2P2HZB4_9CRUS